MDTILREDFGFRRVLWVYSGRRGVHCWVCDSEARRLTNEQRSSVAEYLSLGKANEQSDKKARDGGGGVCPVTLIIALTFLQRAPFMRTQIRLAHPLHPSLAKVYDKVLLPMWLNVRQRGCECSLRMHACMQEVAV